ncbi:hypothetical protein BDP27DRAFT_1322572, partial [Rhodocollybia butyracea]
MTSSSCYASPKNIVTARSSQLRNVKLLDLPLYVVTGELRGAMKKNFVRSMMKNASHGLIEKKKSMRRCASMPLNVEGGLIPN